MLLVFPPKHSLPRAVSSASSLFKQSLYESKIVRSPFLVDGLQAKVSHQSVGQYDGKICFGRQCRCIVVKVVQPGVGEADGEFLDKVHSKRLRNEGLAAAESADRVANSMELLESHSEAAHPGHQPGRFAGPGHEYDGMVHDGMRWHMKHMEIYASNSDTALARLSDADRTLAIKFEAEGGLALCLANAFQRPETLRREAKKVLQALEEGSIPKENLDLTELFETSKTELQSAGFGSGLEVLKGDSPMEKAVVILHAAGVMEEREAVMRNVWSDVEFHAGDTGNAELVTHMEMQFARQLVNTMQSQCSSQNKDIALLATSNQVSNAFEDGNHIFDLVLHGCSERDGVTRKDGSSYCDSDIDKLLEQPKNLGVALDLVGAYLKNYEIDKADLLISRAVPLCRERGGTWLVKGLDKLCAVRMKQFRAYDALIALKEIERSVPFTPDEGWEFHDILYRNLAWCYSSLDEPEKCLEYTRRSVEVKRNSGIAATWFDIWDLGKNHARLGQKTKQRDEMRVGYDLCLKAAELHRKAEPSDKVMLAKILSNVGEVAMGIGDSYKLGEDDVRANEWYRHAENPLCESYNLHSGALGTMKPLSGWAAGTVAHCMVRLGRLRDAAKYLAIALKVECTKDSTTPGSVIELLERVMGCYNELQDLQGMLEHVDDLELCLGGLRARGWDRKERDVFSLLLQKIATAILVADDGTGTMISRALRLLQEAESSLILHLSTTMRHNLLGVQNDQSIQNDGLDVACKQFGPRTDPDELLREVRKSIKVLRLSDQVTDVIHDAAQTEVVEQSVGEGLAYLAHHDRSTCDDPEYDSVAILHNFSLVGTWDDWASFTECVRADTLVESCYEAKVAVPGGQTVEFQILCNNDWNMRFFPGASGNVILGPSSAGHGQNWNLNAPAVPSFLHLKFSLTGKRKVEYWLEAQDA